MEIIYAVIYAIFLWQRLQLELNYAYVITFFKTQLLLVPWGWFNAQTNFLNKITRMEFQCFHNYKEGNDVVDNIANMTPSICIVIWQWKVPPFANSFFYLNVNNKPNYMFC